MKNRLALSASSLVLFATLNLAAFAQNQSVFSPDLKFVRAAHAPTHITPAPKEDATLITIAGNFSRYPDATYFSVFGNTIAQGGVNFPFQVWEAMPFTPTANANVTKLQVSAGRQGSGTAGFELSLYNDANGLPGTPIATAHVSNLPIYGECCAVAEVDDPAGVPVAAGTQYWVVVSTTSEDPDIYAWAFNSSNMTATLAAEWCQGTSTYCGANSGKWTAYQYVQLGFNVLGH
jgi:hypothetical protein